MKIFTPIHVDGKYKHNQGAIQGKKPLTKYQLFKFPTDFHNCHI